MADSTFLGCGLLATAAASLLGLTSLLRGLGYPMPRERAGRWQCESRHPNCFGEVSFWFASALSGVAAAPSDARWLFLGVLVMLGMFLGASISIPMMQKWSLQRRPGYQDVNDRVPRLVRRAAV
jgi:hypothetical protein